MPWIARIRSKDGADVWNNNGAGGCQSRGVTTKKAAETSRNLEEVAGIGRKSGTG